MPFTNRTEAGLALATALKGRQWVRPLVIALPRGGVPVAAPIAEAIDAPLDILLVRKIGAPGNREFAIGAIDEQGHAWFNGESVHDLGLINSDIEPIVAEELETLKHQKLKLKQGRPTPEIHGRDVILVDDGLATGATATSAAHLLKREGARRIILAVPVAARASLEAMKPRVDEVITLESHDDFSSVGLWYEDFGEVTDEEVLRILARMNQPAVREVLISVRTDMPNEFQGELQGELGFPARGKKPSGLVVFAHGSGSSRKSPRNAAVARTLNSLGLATLLFDLLHESEEAERANVFDIPFLASRLLAATRFAREETRLPIAYFGASTGAAAALWAAAEPGNEIDGVVSRGGRPDLAWERLPEVRSQVLLIVGGQDREVLELNRRAGFELPHARLIVIPHATHLFEEPGALESVARRAGNFFLRQFSPLPGLRVRPRAERTRRLGGRRNETP